jgi:hypothetical protein
VPNTQIQSHQEINIR